MRAGPPNPGPRSAATRAGMKSGPARIRGVSIVVPTCKLATLRAEEQTSAANFNQHENSSAFAGLLSAMETLPEALPGEKSSEFITELSMLYLKILTFCHSASSEQWGRTGSGDTEKTAKEKNLARFQGVQKKTQPD